MSVTLSKLSSYQFQGTESIKRAAADFAQQWDLLLGEPWYQPPEQLRSEYARAVLHHPANLYGPPAGDQEFRLQLAGEMGQAVSSEMVLIGNGSKELLWLTLSDSVSKIAAVGCPAYPGHLSQLTAIGTQVVVCAAPGSRGLVTAEMLAEMNETPDLVVVSSPVNPTGAQYDARQAREVVNWCEEHGALLLVDEVYHELKYSGEVSPFVELDRWQNLVVVRSFSKWLGVCGWRMGYLVTARERIERLVKSRKQLLNPAALPLQIALSRSLDGLTDFGFSRAKEFAQSVDQLIPVLQNAGLQVHRPEAGFYLFVNTADTGLPGSEWCHGLARAGGILCWPGDDYLDEWGLRISLGGTPPELVADLAAALSRALAEVSP